MQDSNLRVYALLASIAGWIVCALALMMAVLIAYWLASAEPQGPFSPLLAVIWLASAGANMFGLLSIIPILLWIYTAHANLRAAGVPGLRHSPAWATFSFFVPVMNLFVPFVAMRELANRSAGEPEEFAESSVDDVTSWWSCFVVSMVVGIMVSITLVIDAIPGVYVTTPLWAVMSLLLLGQLLYAGAAFYIVKVVRQVTANQLSGSAQLAMFE